MEMNIRPMETGIKIKQLFRTKFFQPEQGQLKQSLYALDLVLIGIGGTIGAGIFVLTGIAAATKAGPAIVLSYILAGCASAFAAFCYAELASSIGGSGSAYNYAYAGLGELIAWIIGWDLLFEYGLSVCAVSVGWSGYVHDIIGALGYEIPQALLKSPSEGGIVNLPAIIIILLLSGLLALGVRQSSNFNAIIVTIKLIAIAVFIAIALPNVQPENWIPFTPFGWTGIANGAALVFFAYIGFDAVSTTAEETINPQKNLPIGIIGSLVICTLLYIIVSFLLTGIANYTTLNVSSPVASTILHLGYRMGAGIVAAGAIAGLTSVMLIFLYGLSRIFYAMSRDGLLPPFFSKVNPKTKTPILITLCFGVLISFGGGLLPLHELAELVNIGTLAAFIIVCSGVIFLRHTKPNMPRPFKTPFSPIFPLMGIILCVYLMFSLPAITWLRFIIWMFVGLILYFFYGYFHSKLRTSDANQ